LDHWALVGLSQYNIQREAACAFFEWVRDQEVMKQLHVGGDRMLNEALNQALKLKAAKAAAEPPTSKAMSGKGCSSQGPVVAGDQALQD
jgi:hypothetical protein